VEAVTITSRAATVPAGQQMSGWSGVGNHRKSITPYFSAEGRELRQAAAEQTGDFRFSMHDIMKAFEAFGNAAKGRARSFSGRAGLIE
jgi:hypothetical protein